MLRQGIETMICRLQMRFGHHWCNVLIAAVSVLVSRNDQYLPGNVGSQLPEKCGEILFLLATQVDLQNEIKEFNSVLQCQKPSVM